MFNNLTSRGHQHQISRFIYTDPRNTVKRHPNLLGVSVRRNHEIVLQLILRAVIHQVDPGINAPRFHTRVIRDSHDPLRRIVAPEIRRMARQRAFIL